MSIENTKAWTKDTINSNPANKIPISHKLILDARVIKICPAVILARRRKHKVNGRTTTLINSTNPKKGTRYQGELEGNAKETLNLFMDWTKTPPIQQDKANLKLNLITVETGNL